MGDDPLSISASPVKPQAPLKTKWYWPDIVDLESARTAVLRARTAAILVAVMTAVIAVLSMSGAEIFQQMGIDAWALVDVALFIGVAWGLHRMSRIAAVAGLVIYLAERLFMMLEFGAKGLFVTIILTLLFGHGVRGAFAFHRFRASGHDPAIPEVFS